MTHYHISAVLTCPSDWTKEKVIAYMMRILPTSEELESLEVSEVEAGSESRTLRERELRSALRSLLSGPVSVEVLYHARKVLEEMGNECR